MTDVTYTVQAQVWLYPGKAGWHFVTIPPKESEEIKARFGGAKRGWGSLPVRATIGKTSWETSIFPDKEHGYVLPIKSTVRKQEDIGPGDSPVITLEVGGAS